LKWGPNDISLSEFLSDLGSRISVRGVVEVGMSQAMKEASDERFPSATEDAPFLPPIENPSGMLMKIVYYFSRRQFGDKFTAIKVFASRMPPSFGQFMGKAYALDKKLTLQRETAMLVRARVAQINVCSYCIDINRYYAIKESMSEAKWDELEDYRTSPLFSEAERAALDYVTELTEEKRVSPGTFARLSRSYSERAVCEIVWLVASEHLSNLTNIGLNVHSDMLCEIAKKKHV
jgi:AhpD family alkylhydroperoxidase